ncbi:MAG: MYXO-CTERM sorting domain-containing protein [Pseudomonadota bacterium]
MQWTQISEFQAPDTEWHDFFGWDLELDSTMAVVGAPEYDYNATTDTGAAFSFSFLRSAGVPCEAALQCITGHCADGVCCDNDCGNSDPTDCQACTAALGADEDGICSLTTVVCRPAREGAPCDAPEVCDGHTIACPEDVLAGPTVECRGATDSCDVPELCTGSTDQCPTDQQADNGATCENASPCFEGGTCSGGACSGGSYVLSFAPPALSIFTVRDPKVATQVVKNEGTLQTIIVTGVSVSPADLFEIVSPTSWPLEIAPGASASLEIRFVPDSAGTKTGVFYLELAGCDRKMLPLLGVAEPDPVSSDAATLDSDPELDAQSVAADAARVDGGVGSDSGSGSYDGAAGTGADATPADGAKGDTDAKLAGDAQGQRPDGELAVDGSLPTGVDAAAPDADNQGVSESGDSGCNCSVGRPSNPSGTFSSSAAAPLLALLGVFFVRRRRRPRSSP